MTLMTLSPHKFQWRDGKRAALSITFDDARQSQVDRAIPILNAHGVKGTFYVNPPNVKQRLYEWRRAVAAGHEIGNHSMTHPCSGNFRWSRHNALEDYTLARIEADIERANETIRQMLDVTPCTFAYPCAQKFVGRGEHVKSYVPLVARKFLAGRSGFDETPNDPTFCDLAQVLGVVVDRMTFEQIRPLFDDALEHGGWLILVGHEVGDDAHQTWRAKTLEEICRFAQDPANGLRVDTVAAVAAEVKSLRKW
jgi:peptidoglycan/xylan/chitin deacetylase (PgdA/CDA1 family)